MEWFTAIALAASLVCFIAAALNPAKYQQGVAAGLGFWVLVSLVTAVRALN